MQVYNVLLTLEMPVDYDYDEVVLMSKVLTILQSHFKVIKTCHHVFAPGAITFVAILAESHAVVQTYPELNRIYISFEFHEEDVQRRQINDGLLLNDLKHNIGGSVIECVKKER